jgi:hypothetical protein
MKLFRFSAVNLAALVLGFSLLTFTACQKETSDANSAAQEEEASRAASEGDGEAETVFNAIFDDAMGVDNEVGVSGSGVFYGRTDSMTTVPRCFTVTVTRPTTNPFPVRIVVDFGTTGCPGPDGHIRRGKIITEYTNRLIVPGAIATTTFDGFFVDSIKVEGTHKITNTSEPPTVLRRFRTEVINGKITKPSGNFVEWNSTKVVVQVEGLLTPEMPRDDVFRIEGTATGRVRRGNIIVLWNSTVTEPLFRRFTCRHIVKGRIRTVRGNLTTQSPWIAVLDFGNGQCDNQAILTINGVSRQITLP